MPTPSISASVERSVETVPTPATLRAAAAAPAGIGEKPSEFWITSSPWKLRSTAEAIEPFSPAAKIVTKVTRARPIISAAAVAAVRPGSPLGVLPRQAAGEAARASPAGSR